jgi:pimeloyl-ACP methyl ester carboxylesterase
VDDLTYDHIRVNGVTLRVAAAGNGPRLVLCLHGAFELSFSWRHQLPIMAEQGYRVWAPDLRGYGGSSRPGRTNDYAIEHLLADVRGLIDAADATSTTLIGHDWGGIIAWWFAMRHPDLLERLVVMNVPHPAAGGRMLRRLPSQWLRSSYTLFFQVPWLPEHVLRARRARWIVSALRRAAVHSERFPDEVLEVYRRAMLEPGAAKAMLDYYRAYIRGGGHRRQSELGHPVITTPTLLIWGEQDAALRRELTAGTDTYVRDLTLRYLPDASHWVQQDAPDVVNAMLRAFLAGREVLEAHELR